MFRKKSLFKLLLTNLILFIVFLSFSASDTFACFSIVVGKDASASGNVIVAHNEDDAPPQIVNHHKLPRKKFDIGQKIEMLGSRKASKACQTFSCIWSEMPGMDYSDSFINEWGVCVTSSNCPSKEDKPAITEGGIGKMLRREIALNSKTARQAVLLAGKLVEKYGYLDSGRAYIIADPNEGWLFCAVKGKHWLAQRVPDNEVAMIANTYTIRKVNITDSSNFLASADIIDYAIKRGWYNPRQGEFDFAAAYANPKDATSPVNYGRQWAALKHITNKNLPLDWDLPFSVVPDRKIEVAMLMQILRFDNETSKPDFTASCTEEQLNTCIICRGSTQTSFIAQLNINDKLPADIGIVYWLCLSQPAYSCYIPFYFGIDKFPAGYALKSQRPDKETFNEKVNGKFTAEPMQAFWTFSNFSSKIQNAPQNVKQHAKKELNKIEQTAFYLRHQLETPASDLYKKDSSAELLKSYSAGLYLIAIDTIDSVFDEYTKMKP